MNNPLEAVTQAVNSLVTALKLPDESAKANEVLGEMSFPQFSRLLPYRDYNQESGLFMNDTTMGFMLEAIPINGANESIVEALDHMLRTKLPRGIPLCIHLMSSQLVGDRIEYGLREFSWSGEQAERFNAITRAYYMKAAATQFPLPEGMNLPLTLRHYRVFISYCSPSKKKSRADILEMENLVKIIRASLQGASITTQTVDAQAFIDIVGEMINHNPDSLYPKRRQLDPYSDLNYQCVEDSFDLKVRADYLTLGLRENGRNSTARILNFHLARNPEIAFLWNVADNYSNLLNPELSISCPFILTLTLVVEDQVKTHSEANLKYMDLEKKSKTSYAKWFPSVEKEAKEWGELRQRLGSGQSSVVSYFLNITAFCKDNNETALEVEQDILNSFRKNGFELISPRFNHMRNFLTCLPFMAGKGLFKQLKEAGVVQRAESFNVANLMPLVADTPYVVWSESCPFSKELGKLTKTECTEAGGNRTLVKDGQSYSMYQSCWAYRDTYVTQSADKGTCQTYTDNPACTLVSHQCAFYSEEGACLHEYATYSCESKTSGKVMVCGGDVFCLDGECDKAQSGQSNDFAEAVSQLAALAAAGKDVAALNGGDVRAFTGQAKFCKKAAAGYSNCCKDSGWGQDIGLAKCSSDEKALAKAKSNKLTVSVGEFCSKKVLGVCLEKKRSYCQFDSKLAQIVQQQGRNGQLRISFGSAKHPDCRGITVDELQKIQFNRLDFTNFYEDLMNNQKIPDSGVLTQKVKEQIADQLKQAGQ
ncbi:type-F conjugative transfer system mating-pair stabilization protein TraN [Escherichia coli]|uniref:type-F conjugative transfer system mating-pair stabilization protein TraN n=9 Tax=Escherichia coli TaxID=562 RepID=UPI00288A8C1D|nr:type-F conjugative transfer system mating-pair stabilization protein TraN [Escherichia coli]